MTRDTLSPSMRIVVTGGSGFIGSHLVEALAKRRDTVFSLDLRPPQRTFPSVVYAEADFCDAEAVKKIFSKEQPEVIVHLGALPSVHVSIAQPLRSYHANVVGTYTVLEAARLSEAKRVVFASSAAVYGYTGEEYAGKLLSEDLPLRPKNPYGLAKKMGEEMMELWSRGSFWKGIDTVSLRFFNVFGPRQQRDSAYATCIERFLYQRKEGEPFTIVSPGTQRRDCIFVSDVVAAVIATIERREPFGGIPINIGSGKNYSIFEIAEVIGGKGYPHVQISPRAGEVREVLADIRRAKELLGWSPAVSFQEGIFRVKESLTDNLKQ